MSKPPQRLDVSRIGQQPQQMNGAVDLSIAKDAPAEAVEAHRRAQQIEEGLLCQCGQRIHHDGHQVFAWRERALAGPLGAFPAILHVKVHSLSCPVFYEVLNEPALDVFAIRRMPMPTWLDEMSEEEHESLYEAAAQYKAAKEAMNGGES